MDNPSKQPTGEPISCFFLVDLLVIPVFVVHIFFVWEAVCHLVVVVVFVVVVLVVSFGHISLCNHQLVNESLVLLVFFGA